MRDARSIPPRETALFLICYASTSFDLLALLSREKKALFCLPPTSGVDHSFFRLHYRASSKGYEDLTCKMWLLPAQINYIGVDYEVSMQSVAQSLLAAQINGSDQGGTVYLGFKSPFVR